MHVDGFAEPPNMLRPDTIKTMTTASAVNPHYAKGWEVNAANNWWHNGLLPGTSIMAVCTHTGFCWAAFTNTRQGPAMDIDLDRLVWTMAGAVGEWRARPARGDFFASPRWERLPSERVNVYEFATLAKRQCFATLEIALRHPCLTKCGKKELKCRVTP